MNVHLPSAKLQDKVCDTGVFVFCIIILVCIFCALMPVAVWSKVWICGRSLAGIVGLNPTRDMDVCLVSVVCCQLEVGLITHLEES
jgi:hypothetical protein